MRAGSERGWGGAGRRPWKSTPWVVAAVLLSACSALGPPPMAPVSGSALDAAQERWAAHGSDSYRLRVRVRAPRFEVAVYDVQVRNGRLVTVERNGRAVRAEDAAHYDYSVPGLFDLLREDLRLAEMHPIGDVPPVDLRAQFEPKTGRLVRYRRTVGAARRRVLLVEVLQYERQPGSVASACDCGATG